MNQPDDDRLLQAYLDRTLSPDETVVLENRLCEEPELADQLIQIVSDDAVLAEWGATYEFEKSSSTPAEANQNPSQVRSLFFRSRKMAALSMVSLCGVLIILGYFFYGLPTGQPPADILSEVTLSTGEKIQNHIQQTLAEGAAELHFPTGATVLISAPALYEVTGKNSLHLQQGSFIANVPSTGVGFQVDTPHGRVVDLGTLFSVQTAEDQDTRVQVHRGKVIASLVDNKGVVQTSREVIENQSAKLDLTKSEIADTLDSDFVSKAYGITQHSHSVVLQEKMPDALATGKYQVFEHDDLAFVFPERQEVLLTEDLKVVHSPLTVDSTPEDLLASQTTIPAGTKVDCFRVYYDPALKEGAFLPVQGEIHFDRPILGVILSRKILKTTDRFFHPLCKENPNREIVHQGTETDEGIKDSKARYDEVTISGDRRSLSFLLLSGERFVDEFRVIVQSREDPPEV